MLTVRLGSTQVISRPSGFQTWFVLIPTCLSASTSPLPPIGRGCVLGELHRIFALFDLWISTNDRLPTTDGCKFTARRSSVPNSLTPTYVFRSSPLSHSPPHPSVIDYIHHWPSVPLLPPCRITTTRRRCTALLSTATRGWCGCCWRSWPTRPWGTTSSRRRWTWRRCTAAWRWSSCCSAPTPTCSTATPRSTRRCTWPPATDTCRWWRCCWTPAWTSTTRSGTDFPQYVCNQTPSTCSVKMLLAPILLFPSFRLSIFRSLFDTLAALSLQFVAI